MYKFFAFLFLFCFFTESFSQTVETLKKSSENHSKNSGSNSGSSSGGKSGNSGNQGQNRGSGNSNNGYSGGVSSEVDPSCLADGCLILFDILSSIDLSETNTTPEPQSNNQDYNPDSIPNKSPNSENPPLKKTYKENAGEEYLPVKKIPFEKMSISVRGSFYPANYHLWVPEVTISQGHYSFSARLLEIAEQGLDKTEHYSTFDIQPFQINFENQHNFLFKIGIGGMAETFSDNIYFEFTSNMKWRIGENLDMGIEGRLATNNGIVRQEASMQLNYALWQKNNKQLLVGLNGMMSQYYQEVNINTFGFSAGFRF